MTDNITPEALWSHVVCPRSDTPCPTCRDLLRAAASTIEATP